MGTRAGNAPLRLMIVDDSIVARSVLGRMIEARPEFEIVASFGSAAQALTRLAAVDVDVILLDLAMPGLDGFTALPELVARSRGAHVLIVSSAAADGAQACVRALTLGAADTLLKPSAGSFGHGFDVALADKLVRIGRARRTAALVPSCDPVAGAAAEPPFQTRTPVSGAIACLGVGASTGGLHALSGLFKALPPAIVAPILVTQHLPTDFMPYFAAQLRDIAGRPVRVAADGMALVPGEILVAPGDAHIGLDTGSAPRVKLSRAAAASGCRPSVDPMFSAIARRFGSGAVGVVLTGMGRDGAIGAADIVARGGDVLVQDPASSVVWGMPGVIANAGLASAVLPPAAIAARLARRASAAQAERSRIGGRGWR